VYYLTLKLIEPKKGDVRDPNWSQRFMYTLNTLGGHCVRDFCTLAWPLIELMHLSMKKKKNMFESLSCTFSRYVRYVNEWMNLWGGQPLNESDFRKELPTTHTCTQIWLYFVCMRENRSNRIGKTSRKREKKREQMHFAACYISLSVSKEMVGDFLPPHSRRRWR